MNAYIVDTETTGLTGQVIELCALPVTNLTNFIASATIDKWLHTFKVGNPAWHGTRNFVERFYPNKPEGVTSKFYDTNWHVSELAAYNVHKIDKMDLKGCRSSKEAKLPDDCTYMIAHNAKFDYGILGEPYGVKQICTINLLKQCVKKNLLVLPIPEGKKAPSYSLANVIAGLFPEEAEQLNSRQHTALGDSIKCILILLKVLAVLPEVTSWEELYNFQFSK